MLQPQPVGPVATAGASLLNQQQFMFVCLAAIALLAGIAVILWQNWTLAKQLKHMEYSMMRTRGKRSHASSEKSEAPVDSEDRDDEPEKDGEAGDKISTKYTCSCGRKWKVRSRGTYKCKCGHKFTI